MTSADKLVYCSLMDSPKRCRQIMIQGKVRSLPVIDNGEIRGIITEHALDSLAFFYDHLNNKLEDVMVTKGLTKTEIRVPKEAVRRQVKYIE